MTDLEIFLLILGILIIIGIIIIVILAAVGVWGVRRENNLLNGTFSWHPILDSSRYVTPIPTPGKSPASGDALVTSNSSSVACGSYQWTHTDNFLELGTSGLVATVAAKTNGTPIVLASKGTAGDLNQWVYQDLDFTWCLKSDNHLCIQDNANKLVLNNISVNQSFGWGITSALTTPSCT